MDVRTFIFFVLLPPLNFTHSVYVSGTIDQNKTFFYRKLPVTPSVRATINYVISYKQRSIHKGQYPLMGIYTEYPKVNIQRHCSKIRYAQLRNENLHPHLRLDRPYRTTSCEMSEGDDTVNCRGRVDIQDYIPRNFHLTFGFHCHWRPGNSLQGLIYNISFTKQSNKTNSCILSYRSPNFLTKCNVFYNETSLPNLIGTEFFKIEKIRNFDQILKTYQALAFVDGTCYQHMWEVLCHILLPKCDPVTKQVIHPCREMCWDLINGCWNKIASLAKKLSRDLDYNNVYTFDVTTVTDCDYLPSLHSNIPCFYKPVTCGPLPDVTNSTVMVNGTQKDVYRLHDMVQYACVNETFEMKGNNTIECLYSGQWSTAPPKCVTVNNNRRKFVYLVLPITLVVLLVLFLFIGIKYERKSSPDLNEERIELDNTLVLLTDSDDQLLPSKRKQESTLSLDSVPSLKRKREFDAFVLYHFDSDHDFVINSLLPELEEIRNIKLKIHSRDFQPGRKIEQNIEEAIKSSNNAIILMSAGFTTSEWCREEFSHSYIEHVEDPSFKLFIILMDPVRDLQDLTLNMKKFIAEQTYLELEDPDLFTKLCRYLKPDDDSDAHDTG